MGKNKLGKTLRKNAPIIFKIAGLAGLIISPILAVPSTVKAVRACDRRKEELEIEKLPVGEIVKTSWKYYIPILSLMGASTVSMVNGESLSSKRTAFLSAAYNAAEQTLVDYKEETRKQIGETKERQIEQKVYEKQVAEKKESQKSIGVQGEGGTLFYEPITGTFFYSTRNKIDKAFNELSAQMIRENYVDLEDLFNYLGLRVVDACHLVGWSAGKHKTVEPEYIWFGEEETCTPYAIMSYRYYPTTDFLTY